MEGGGLQGPLHLPTTSTEERMYVPTGAIDAFALDFQTAAFDEIPDRVAVEDVDVPRVVPSEPGCPKV